MEDRTRRAMLATTGTAIATAVAGCSTGGDATTSAGADTTSGEPTTATDASADTGESTTTDGETPTDSGSVAATVTVAPDDNLRFAPDAVTVEVGDVVEWEWAGSGHNVVVDEQPDGANWSGTDGGGATTYDSGHTHSHAFEVAGTYSYYCSPHQGAGMTGEVVVE